MDDPFENYETEQQEKLNQEKLKQELEKLAIDLKVLKDELGAYGIRVESVLGQNGENDEPFARDRDIRLWWLTTLSKYKNSMDAAEKEAKFPGVHFASCIVSQVKKEEMLRKKQEKEFATNSAFSQFHELRVVKITDEDFEFRELIPRVIDLCYDNENWSEGERTTSSVDLVQHDDLVKELWFRIRYHFDISDISDYPLGLSRDDVFHFFGDAIECYCELKNYKDATKQFVSDVMNLIAAMRILFEFLDVADRCNEVHKEISLHCLKNCLTIILGSALEMIKSMKFLDCILAVVEYQEAISNISSDDDSMNRDLTTLDSQNLNLSNVLSLFGSCVPSPPRLKIEFGERGEDEPTLNNLSNPILFHGGRGCRLRVDAETLHILALTFKAAIRAGVVQPKPQDAMIAFTYDDEKKDQAAFLIQKDGTISVEKVQNDVEDMLQRNIGIKSHRRGVPIMKVTGIEGGRGLRGEGWNVHIFKFKCEESGILEKYSHLTRLCEARGGYAADKRIHTLARETGLDVFVCVEFQTVLKFFAAGPGQNPYAGSNCTFEEIRKKMVEHVQFEKEPLIVGASASPLVPFPFERLPNPNRNKRDATDAAMHATDCPKRQKQI